MIVVDTSPLVAILNERDIDHERCLEWISRTNEQLIVPTPILAEVCYLINREAGPRSEAIFLRELATSPRFELAAIRPTDLLRMADLVEQYGDFPLGGADASVITVAERLDVTTVATLDERHFRAVRPNHVEAFTLVP